MSDFYRSHKCLALLNTCVGGRNKNERQIEECCKLNVEKFKRQGFGRDNKSTISELFVSFFAQVVVND